MTLRALDLVIAFLVGLALGLVLASLANPQTFHSLFNSKEADS